MGSEGVLVILYTSLEIGNSLVNAEASQIIIFIHKIEHHPMIPFYYLIGAFGNINPWIWAECVHIQHRFRH